MDILMRGRAIVPTVLVLGSFAYFASTLNHWLGQGPTSHVIANTNYGPCRGIRQVSRTGRNFYEFRGIPYAQPPVGILRFEPPVEVEPWEDVLDATNYGSTCLQYEYLTKILQGSEDCLFLNVASHKVLTKREARLATLLPVLVFIHGGAFMSGFSNVYRPKYFLDESIVLVTINYRLSSFGFLNTGDDVVRGNMGLKDQVLALRWVQDNIGFFGGDPNRVTIVGESAGGASVHFHMLSPLSRGLFHGAIAQSGSALNSFALTKKPRKQAERLAQKLNCPTKNSTEMVYCLKSKQSLELNSVHYEYLDFFSPKEAYFSPSVESVNDSNAFLTDHPRTLIEKGKVHNVPMIMGANSDEGLLFIVDALMNKTRFLGLNNNWQVLAPRIFNYEDHPNRENISRAIRKYYLGKKPFNMDTMKSAVNLFSDRFFFDGLHDTALLQSKFAPVYAYYFTYQGLFGFANFLFGMTRFWPEPLDAIWSATYNWFSSNILQREKKNFGVCHSDDLPIFFNLPVVAQEIIPGAEDYPFSRAAVRLWTSFAYSGKPADVYGVKWERVSSSTNKGGNTSVSARYLKLDDEPKMIDEPFAERIQFWKSLNLDA